jgi:hypothetical protein
VTGFGVNESLVQDLNVVFEARYMALQCFHVFLLFVDNPLLRLDGLGLNFRID